MFWALLHDQLFKMIVTIVKWKISANERGYELHCLFTTVWFIKFYYFVTIVRDMYKKVINKSVGKLLLLRSKIKYLSNLQLLLLQAASTSNFHNQLPSAFSLNPSFPSGLSRLPAPPGTPLCWGLSGKPTGRECCRSRRWPGGTGPWPSAIPWGTERRRPQRFGRRSWPAWGCRRTGGYSLGPSGGLLLGLLGRSCLGILDHQCSGSLKVILFINLRCFNGNFQLGTLKGSKTTYFWMDDM